MAAASSITLNVRWTGVIDLSEDSNTSTIYDLSDLHSVLREGIDQQATTSAYDLIVPIIKQPNRMHKQWQLTNSRRQSNSRPHLTITIL